MDVWREVKDWQEHPIYYEKVAEVKTKEEFNEIKLAGKVELRDKGKLVSAVYRDRPGRA